MDDDDPSPHGNSSQIMWLQKKVILKSVYPPSVVRLRVRRVGRTIPYCQPSFSNNGRIWEVNEATLFSIHDLLSSSIENGEGEGTASLLLLQAVIEEEGMNGKR